MKHFSKHKTVFCLLFLLSGMSLFSACTFQTSAPLASASTETASVPFSESQTEPMTEATALSPAAPTDTQSPKEEPVTPNYTEKTDTQTNEKETIDASVYGLYFKTGDALYRMTLSPGLPSSDGNLQICVSKRLPESSVYTEGLHEFSISYQDSVSSYSSADTLSDAADTRYMIEKNSDSSFTLAGDTEAAGTYYPCEGNLILPAAFCRPLNSTDFIGMNKETLSLLRNEFYAVYGRIFKTPSLQDYFGSKPWYRGTLDETSFTEERFGGMEKRNIFLIQEAEKNYDETQMKMQKEAYDALKPAPYLDLLPSTGETSILFDESFDAVIDHGIYYEAQGTISVPVTVTPAQYQLLQSGQEICVVTNELCHETTILKPTDNPDYGNYILQYPEYDRYVMIDYQQDKQEYYLWANSADTIFKEVYQGPIYVLKGACMEYYRYFDLPISDTESDALLWVQPMDFEPSSSYSDSYYGNIPITDSKGYLKALYFWGD